VRVQPSWPITNVLFGILRTWPPRAEQTRLIAALAPRIVQIVDSMVDHRRTDALILIAKALDK
jgi:hypothetical protein